MNNTSTPETDAQFKLFSEGDVERSNPLVSADFARKLEGERDELRLRIDNLEASSIHSCHDQCQRPACKARRERYEARKAAKDLAKTVLLHVREHEDEQGVRLAREWSEKT